MKKSKKPRKMRQKKKKKNWGWQLSSWQMFFFGGGKCPNLGVVNVRLANNLTPLCNIHFSSNSIQLPIHQFQSLSIGMPGMFSLHGKGEGAEADKPQDMLRQTDTLPLLQALCFRHFVLDKLSNSTKPELSTLLLTLCPF